MSEINNPAVAPASASTATSPAETGAVDAYRRATESRPTNFADNPIGAMANAMDKLGRAAGSMIHGKAAEGHDGLGPAEQRLMKANEAARANPGSLAAKQDQLKAGLELLREMQGLAPNDPRRVKVAGFVVKLANQLGASGLPLGVAGLDVLGLLRLAAGITSRFGDAQGMQDAFALEQLLAGSVAGSSVEATQLRDQLMQRFGLSRAAQALIANGWKVRVANPGELASLDVSARTISLSAQQDNPNLGVLARAYWQDASLQSPADKDGFVQAFLKVANSGTFGVLTRRYRDVKRMARNELGHARPLASVGTGTVMTVAPREQLADDSGDMFAALASYSRGDDGGQLPADLQPALQRFFA